MKRLAIFASGSGSNAQRIAEYFKDNQEVEISLILSNKKNAFVLERAKDLGISSMTFDRSMFYESDEIVAILKDKNIDLVVLAGFLWLIPSSLIAAFPDKIINIHPALLPSYGGKGMYGMKVHEAVIENEESVSGITIHFVNENYDEGKHIFQAGTELSKRETPETLAAKIHKLEHEHFPKVIERVLFPQ